eukprot:1152702-Pelagomonas_calceolata.AAC.1
MAGLGLPVMEDVFNFLQKQTNEIIVKEKKEKSTPAKRPRALRKGSLASKLERVSPKGPQA